MVTIHADERWLLKDLGRFIEPVEVCDAEGKLLGLFVPANMERCKEKYAEIIAKIDWAEIERRRNDPRPGVPLQKTLSLLKVLEEEFARRKAAGEPAMTHEEAMAYYRALRDGSSTTGVSGSSSSPHTQEASACATP